MIPERLEQLLRQLESKVRSASPDPGSISELVDQMLQCLQEIRRSDVPAMRPEVEAALRQLSLEQAGAAVKPESLDLKDFLASRLRKISDGMRVEAGAPSEMLQVAIDHTLGSWLARCYTESLPNPFDAQPPFQSQPGSVPANPTPRLSPRFSRQLRVELDAALVPDLSVLPSALEPIKQRMLTDWGFAVQSVWLPFATSEGSEPKKAHFWFKEQLIKQLSIPNGHSLAWGTRNQVSPLGDCLDDGLIKLGHACWIRPEQRALALERGCAIYDLPALLAAVFGSLVSRHPCLALDIQSTTGLRDSLVKSYPAIVVDLKAIGLSYQETHTILQSMLSQHASLLNPVEIFSRIVQLWPRARGQARARNVAEQIRNVLPISRNASFLHGSVPVTFLLPPRNWNLQYRLFPWRRRALIGKLSRALRLVWMSWQEPDCQAVLAVDDSIRPSVGRALTRELGMGSQLALPVLGASDVRILSDCARHQLEL